MDLSLKLGVENLEKLLGKHRPRVEILVGLEIELKRWLLVFGHNVFVCKALEHRVDLLSQQSRLRKMSAEFQKVHQSDRPSSAQIKYVEHHKIALFP